MKHYHPDYQGEDKILCMFHKERSPSFNVYHHQNTYYCFGCGAGSTVIDFVADSEGLDVNVEFKKARDITLGILGLTNEQFQEERKKVTDAQVMTNDCLPAMTDEEVKAFIQSAHREINGRKVSGYSGMGYRGIKDEYLKFFGHLTKKDDDGKVISRHYPETNTKGKLAGYKCRNHPKDFRYGNVGSTGGKNQLSGQIKYSGHNKYILIVGGEEDKVAAYQMFEENRAGKGNIAPIHVVSPTCGENSAVKQIAAQYSFFDMYDQIIIGMDNDEAGHKAAKAIAEVLPKEKVKVVVWTGKDANKMLEDGLAGVFVRDFYNAKPLIASGIKESTSSMDSVREELMRPRIPLPPEWKDVQDAMKGGIRQGSIVNIIGDTSVGKSTHVNGLNYFWMFNAPQKVGVVSLEMTEGQYTLDLLSIHLEKNLAWIGEGADILEYLDRPEVQALYDNLLVDDSGQPRYSILDERDGDLKLLERQIEKLIHQYGCKIIVIDVLTDILRGANGDMQEDHMRWQKQIVKTGVTIVNILHTRKPVNSDGSWRKASEYDAFGSSTFVQSAAYNIVISRDKMNPDPIIRNLTHVDMPKARGGETGEIMQLIYDVETRQVMNYNNWLNKQTSIDQALNPKVPDVEF
jgi:archaellum biogenesis ATPase FlaH/5S rRNA maturation endonuclease (ribonuclease M5)